ncbi:MAG TPA: hypothetical protein VNL71_20740 [Chloroflexota bacterium]|nr:hypothetical protein [Chloroflexota bacterium]
MRLLLPDPVPVTPPPKNERALATPSVPAAAPTPAGRTHIEITGKIRAKSKDY